MSKFLGILKQSFKLSTAYRFEYFFTLILAPISLLVVYFLWKAIYTNTGQIIAGFTFTELITYYLLTWVVFTLTWSSIEDEMRSEIRSGRMTTEILKPIDYFTYKLFISTGNRLFSLFTEGIPLLLFGLIFLQVKVDFPLTPFFIISVIFGFTVNYLLAFATGMSCFWIVNNSGIKKFRRILTSFLGGSIVPITFFPGYAQKILSFMPFQYIAFTPILIWIGKYPAKEMIMAIASQVAWVIILYVICMFVWKKAIKKYTAVGT